MNRSPRSIVNPYAPPESTASKSGSSFILPRRPILPSLFVLSGIVIGVIALFGWPLYGLAALVVTHIVDRRFFHGPRFIPDLIDVPQKAERLPLRTLGEPTRMRRVVIDVDIDHGDGTTLDEPDGIPPRLRVVESAAQNSARR